MGARERPRVLCVDDEQRLLDGLQLILGRSHDLRFALNGRDGLGVLQDDGPFAVVISDMRMPGMSGAEFLAEARRIAPHTVRLLLTGQADVESAIEAVNEGQLFRFLTKPCPVERLQRALADAIEQHRLVESERELLEQTLMGSLQTLSDVLALANPEAFGRATRVKYQVSHLAEHLQLMPRWDVEVAAMLSQIGYVTLTAETVTRIQYGQPLSAEEQRMAARVPEVNQALLAHIPRLERVRAILANVERAFVASGPAPAVEAPPDVMERAHLLRVALDFDRLEGQGHSPAAALDVMQGRTGRYDPALLEALTSLHVASAGEEVVQALPACAIRSDMVLEEDLRLRSGMMLAPRGYVVTATLVERVRNYPPGSIVEPVRCRVPGTPARAA